MTPFSRLFPLFGLLWMATSAWADSPRLTGSTPLGVRRGATVEVTFQGTGLGDHPRLVAPFGFRLEESAGSSSEGTKWAVRLVADARTPVGVYPVRVVTEAGISNPLLFAVGQVEQVSEVEPNNAAMSAQAIPNPAVVEGECPGNDRDFFRFEGHKGDRVVVDALGARIGSEVDPMIRLTTAGGRLVASADDTPGLVTDAYLTAMLPEDGAYLLEFCDSRYEGAGRTVYRLTIGSIPFAGEVHPFVAPRGQNTALELRGGTLSAECLFALRTPSDPKLATFQPAIPARLIGDPAWANSDLDVELPAPIPLGPAVTILESADPTQELPPLSPPATILGRLSKAGERDEFTIAAAPGSKYEVRVEAWGLGSALDAQLRVFDEGGKRLGESDDGKPGQGRRQGGGGGGRRAAPTSTDPTFDLTMPKDQGRVKLLVKDLADRGGVGFSYRLVVEPASPSFKLALDEWQAAIPRGGLALIPVTVTRAGYDGPITLEVQGLSGGSRVTALPGSVPAGQTRGLIALKADAEADFPPRELQVVGKGEDGRAVVASGVTVFSKQTMAVPGFGMSGTIPSYSRHTTSLFAAVCKAGPIRLKPEVDRLVVPRGGSVEATLQVEKAGEDQAAYKLVSPTAPNGLTVAETEIAAKDSTAKVRITVAKDAPLGPAAVGLIARAGKSETPVASTLITVEVGKAP